MLRIALDAATFLGGLSALFYFGERLMLPPTGRFSPQTTTTRAPARAAVLAVLRGLPVSTRVVLGLQWIATVYISGHISRGLPFVALVLPLWVVPLALAIRGFIADTEGVARIIGGVLGGIVGAAIAYARVDWATSYGLFTGIFFGTLVSGHVSSPARRTSLVSATLSTSILLLALGVFHDLKFFLEPDGTAFIDGAIAVILWLVAACVTGLITMLRTRYPGGRWPW